MSLAASPADHEGGRAERPDADPVGRVSLRAHIINILSYGYQCIHMYIYIYIERETPLSLSLSLNICIYVCITIHTYTCTYTYAGPVGRDSLRQSYSIV